MKRILSTTLAIVLIVGASQAQTTEKKDRHHQGDRKEMAQSLNLSAEQKAQFKTLQEAQKKELQELKKSGDVTPEQRKALHEKYRSQFHALLTPTQQAEMKKNREDWKDNANNGRKEGKGARAGKRGGDIGPQVAFLQKELNLTASQEAQIKTIFGDFRTKADGIRFNSNLSHEQKRSQMQNLGKQYMAQGKSVLSPEQAKKFEELKTKRNTKKSRNL